MEAGYGEIYRCHKESHWHVHYSVEVSVLSWRSGKAYLGTGHYLRGEGGLQNDKGQVKFYPPQKGVTEQVLGLLKGERKRFWIVLTRA